MIKTGVSIKDFVAKLNEDFNSKQNTLTPESGIEISENNKIGIKVGSGLTIDSQGNLQNALINGVEWNYYEYILNENSKVVEFDLPTPCSDKLGLYIFLNGITPIPYQMIALSNKGYTITLTSDEDFVSGSKFECRWTSYMSLQPQLFLFSTIRSDYTINDVSWLKSDTFSWHSGDVYKRAYDHLVEDYENSTEDLSDTFGSIVINYRKASDGHKICLADQNDLLQSLFEQEGVSWYYMIDTTNKKFKLPRSNYNFTGISSGIGDVSSLTSTSGTGENKDIQSYLYFFMGRYEELETKITSGSGRNIGDIFYTSRLDTELNGAVEANGGIYNVADYIGRQNVPALLVAGKLPFVSMSEYESIVSANGSCRAWGWDNGDTFRVPLLKDVYLMAGEAESAGEFISESLPNISGYGGSILNNNPSGVFSSSRVIGTASVPTGSHNQIGLTFNASNSSSTYQDGAKVRPDSVRYRAMVQLATGTTDEALTTCTGVLTDVARLKDASNFTTTGKSVLSGFGMPSNRYIDLTLLASGSTYTAPANGKFVISKVATGTQDVVIDLFPVDGIGTRCVASNAPEAGWTCAASMDCKKGDSIKVYYSADGDLNNFRFIYAEGEN